MTLLQSLILGIIQGISEFIPISSSAHLVLIPAIFNWDISESETFIFSVLVQWGTLIAVIIYFWKDLGLISIGMLKSLRTQKIDSEDARMGWLIMLGTVPALAIGWFFREAIKSTFINPAITGWFLILTAGLLIFADLVGKRDRAYPDVTKIDAVIIGIFQAISLLPGISRSGASIAGGIVRNLSRRSAARFSFLLSVPVMIAAGSVALLELNTLPSMEEFFPVLLVGFAISAIIGYFSIQWLIHYLSMRPLYPFALYCVLVGTIMLIFFGG
jgi:undecaprenyl-diphosphatase